MQIIYLDVLLIFNLYMNYLLLCMTARMTHTRFIFWKGFIGAGIGSLSSLLVFLPEMPFLLSWMMKLLTAFLICLTAFGRKRILRNCMSFFGISFLTAGGMYALSVCSQMTSLHRNGCYYFDISLISLIAFTVTAYILLSVMQFLYDRNQFCENTYQIAVKYHQQTACMEGLADTGNSLTDFYTGKPVIICDRTLLGAMAEPEHSHIVPYLTVAGSGTLKVFQPDEIIISPEYGTAKTVDALIGIGAQENGKAIFNPKLMRF
ncbi:MAG: sigma-E processing peptidase SpoIIGA [Oscillospiraceae bacterium]|nr:sigma-E processing peptidase SpoIIGA [Oscillospiraceae bacterium]